MECIEYYGGVVAGVVAIFSTVKQLDNTEVFSLFSTDDLPGYATYPKYDCPYCKKKIPLEAMVNGYGIAKL